MGASRHLTSSILVFLVCCNAALASDVQRKREHWRALRQEAQAYEHGEGVPRDAVRAARIYCEAARAGDPESQFSLGWMYANGRGVERDDVIAAYFFRLASNQGNDYARRMLKYVGDAAGEGPPCVRLVESAGRLAYRIDEAEILTGNTPAQRQAVELVHKLAPEYGVYPQLALAVIRAESNFNPAATSAKNAQGLMQLIPETSARFAVKKPFDPEQNIRGGLAYLRWLLAYFQGNVALVAAAYNAGEGAVNRFQGIPPYAETKQYVKRIIEIFKAEEHPYDPSVTDPSPALAKILKGQKRPGRRLG